MRKKFLLSLLSVAVTALVLAGCGGEGSGAGATKAGSSTETVVTNAGTDAEANGETTTSGEALNGSAKTGESGNTEEAATALCEDESKHSDKPYVSCWNGTVQCDSEGHYLSEDYCISGTFHDTQDSLILKTEYLDTLTEAQRNGKELIQLDKEGNAFGLVAFFKEETGIMYVDAEMLYDKLISMYEELGDDALSIEVNHIDTVATADGSSLDDDYTFCVGYLRMYNDKDWLNPADKCCYYKPIEWTKLPFYSYLTTFNEAFPPVVVRPADAWPDPSEYELVSLMNGAQIYLSSIDVAEIESIIAEPNFLSVWTKRMEELNGKYNISGFWCTAGKGCSFACGTDNYDDIVKTQQLLDEIASTYGYTVQYRYGN